MRLQIYTDGACSGNPGPGGWACIINLKKEINKISGCSTNTTNNQMELTAALMALKWLQRNYKVLYEYDTYEIYSDSAYVVNTINKNWLENWKKNDWKTKDKKDVKNRELWEAIDAILSKKDFNVTFIKVKGHKGVFLNELADKEARKQVDKLL